MRGECRGRFPHHQGLAFPTCVAARDRQPTVSFEVCGMKNVPGIPGTCATCNCAHLVRGPLYLII